MQLLPVDPLLMLLVAPSAPEAAAASFEEMLRSAPEREPEPDAHRDLSRQDAEDEPPDAEDPTPLFVALPTDAVEPVLHARPERSEPIVCASVARDPGLHEPVLHETVLHEPGPHGTGLHETGPSLARDLAAPQPVETPQPTALPEQAPPGKPYDVERPTFEALARPDHAPRGAEVDEGPEVGPTREDLQLALDEAIETVEVVAPTRPRPIRLQPAPRTELTPIDFEPAEPQQVDEPVRVDPIELALAPDFEVPELAAPAPKTVRVRVDEDLDVEITADGDGVEVTLEGAAEAVEELDDIGPELQEELARAGFHLRDFQRRERQQEFELPEGTQEADAVELDEPTVDTPRVIRGELLDVIA